MLPRIPKIFLQRVSGWVGERGCPKAPSLTISCEHFSAGSIMHFSSCAANTSVLIAAVSNFGSRFALLIAELT